MSLVTTTLWSPNHYAGNSGRIFIGIHTMEAAEAGDTAERVARYFQKPEVKASAHWCVDNNSRVRCVSDADSAWTMPPVNEISLNVEMAGFAGQTPKQWADAYSRDTLDNVAYCVAEWCHKFTIPVRHLTDSQIEARQKGIVGHADINRVFHKSTHWDPGPDFPWSAFLDMVRRHSAVVSYPYVPPWPYPAGHYLGKPSSDEHCHSGCYGGADHTVVWTWQRKMQDRGWSIVTSGCYGENSRQICAQFQKEKQLTVDGLVGPQTWRATWSAPVT